MAEQTPATGVPAGTPPAGAAPDDAALDARIVRLVKQGLTEHLAEEATRRTEAAAANGDGKSFLERLFS